MTDKKQALPRYMTHPVLWAQGPRKLSTNPRTLGADSAKLLSLSLDYTRQGEALEDGRTQDVCHAAALYLKQAGDALGVESASLRRHCIDEEEGEG